MTLKELSQLYWLNREIELNKERLAELESKLELIRSASSFSDVPLHGGVNVNKIERYVEEVVDLQAIISSKQQQCIHERNRLERWIADISDSLLRQIFTLRFINGLSWPQVAAHIGGGNTEAGVKMACYRYLDRINSKK